MDSKQKWIEKAYENFGFYGPDDLSIQKIGKEIECPRTSFYYHFADKEDLIEHLIAAHVQTVEIYISAFKEEVKTLLPDLHVLNVKFISAIRFQKRLFLNRTNPLYNMAYINTTKASNPLIVPLFTKYCNLHIPYSIAEMLWETLTESWYSRLDCDKISVEYCCNLTKEIANSVMSIYRSKQIFDIQES